MKMENFRHLSILLLIFFIMSCNLDVNTSDPQASSDIGTSKQDGFFVAEYGNSGNKSEIFKISQAWVESVWFNNLDNGKVNKRKSGGFQLNLKLNDFSNRDFAEDKYLSKWEMKDDKNNVVGTGNGVYILLLKGVVIPDTFHISLCKVNSDMSTSTLGQITLVRKK